MSGMELAETGVGEVALGVALCVEFIMVVIIAVGTIRAIITVVKTLLRDGGLAPSIREIWLHYAAWILLSLELALAADLIRTVVAPSWSDIGQLAAIAAVRTALAYFLGRDIADFSANRYVNRAGATARPNVDA